MKEIPVTKVRASFLLNQILKGNENVDGKGDKILCSHKDYIFPLSPEFDDVFKFEFASVEFQKPLDQIYLDDEFDLETFGIPEDRLDEICSKGIGYGSPLSDLVEYGLKFEKNELPDDFLSLIWYGCYIKISELKKEEILSTRFFINENHDSLYEVGKPEIQY